MLELCRSLDGLPLAIELAAARTKTLSIEEITRRLDDRFAVLSDPTSRRPERRRALRSTIAWSYELLFPDDQRGLWALATFAGGAPLPAVEFVLEALDVPAAAAIDVVGRLASRSLVIVDDEGRRRRRAPVRYRLLDSIRAFALEAMADAGLTERALAAHAAWFADAAAVLDRRVCAAPTRPSTSPFARAERANIDAALAWSAAHDPLLALGIVNGFGWAWVVLGDSRGAQRILAALDAAGDVAPARDRADALLLAAGSRRRPVDLDLPAQHIAAATELADAIDDADLQARCSYYLAYVVSHHGEFASGAGADRPQPSALRRARPAVGPGRQRAVRRPGRDLGRRRDAQRRGCATRCSTGCGRSTTRGCTSAATRCSASSPGSSTGSTTPSSTSAGPPRHRARSASSRPRPTRSSSLGRAQCQAGDYEAGAATLELAIDKAEATGDVRLAALARVHLGRVLRALGRDRRRRGRRSSRPPPWHRDAGGGEQAALGECLLAAMDAADERARRRGPPRRRPRRGPARRRRPGRGLRARRPGPLRRRGRRPRHGSGALRGSRPRAWTPPPTSSPSATGPTPAG